MPDIIRTKLNSIWISEWAKKLILKIFLILQILSYYLVFWITHGREKAKSPNRKIAIKMFLFIVHTWFKLHLKADECAVPTHVQPFSLDILFTKYFILKWNKAMVLWDTLRKFSKFNKLLLYNNFINKNTFNITL